MIRLAKLLINRPTFQEELEEQYIEAKELSANRELVAALNLYNGILIVQRNKLGKDHLDCGKTLNDIGVVLMQMGENFPALTALKEALYIRKKALEVDASEVVETSIYIDALMDKIHETEEEANKQRKKRESVQVQQSLGSMVIDQCEVANTTDDAEQEERREIGCQKVI